MEAGAPASETITLTRSPELVTVRDTVRDNDERGERSDGEHCRGVECSQRNRITSLTVSHQSS